MNYLPFNDMLSSRSRLNVLRATYPYIDTVYFVKITFNSIPEVVTLGTFGLCLELDGAKECSPGVTGYQLDDLLFTGSVPLPEISSTLTKGLTLHVVAFVLALVTATIILCSNFQNSSLGRWIVETIVLLGLFVIASLTVDLALFFSVRKAFANTNASVQIGNGTWLTSTSLIFLLLGSGMGIVLPKPVPSISEDIENASDDSWGDGCPEVLHIRPSSDGEYKEGNSDRHSMSLPQNRSLKGTRTSKTSGNSPKPLQSRLQLINDAVLWAEASGTINEELPPLSPLRRIPSILINGAHRDSIQSDVLPSTIHPSSSSRTPSDGSSTGMTSSQTLSRSSTASTVLSGSVFGRQAARRSTQDWLNYERRNGKGRQFVNSVSTLGSVIQHFPAIPCPRSVAPPSFALFHLRDRFKEFDPAFNAEVRSMVSAVPSSDLELDVQTAPSSSPRIPLPRELPKIPDIPRHSDQISLA
ncbi:hypothetical protein BJ912DRAFT_919972 [Pholiota molesta]|nr:hypothetical protein BJ912DRAFT_919972 [Pholiota molesta]